MTAQTRAYQSVADIRAPEWQVLASKRILFGHQSVGSNIISGVEEIMSVHKQVKMNISRVEGAATILKPGFYHFGVGRNADPRSKIDDFVHRLRAGLGSDVDMAFFKFCYVDFDAATDAGALFRDYQRAMTDLKKEFPKIVFAHVTVPLVTVQSGPKAWVKKILGKTVYGTEDNYRRNEFNTLLLATYTGIEPVFDLAKMESTYPDGARSKTVSNNREIFVLAPEYTSDGGHLNQAGRVRLAAEFLRFLASTR